MKHSSQLTAADGVVIFIGIAVGAFAVYNWWPDYAGMSLGGVIGGAVAYLACKLPETLQAIWEVLGNQRIIGNWILWALAIAIPAFSVVWGLSVLNKVFAEASGPHAALNVLGNAQSAAMGFLASPAWAYVIGGLAVVGGLGLACARVSYNDESLRPRTALMWLAFFNPLATGLYVGAIIVAVIVLGFLVELPAIVWKVAALAFAAAILWAVLVALWEVFVRIHCARRTACFAYAASWSLAGGIGAHKFPFLLVTLPIAPRLPPETFAVLGAALAGALMALLMQRLLQVPIAKAIAADAAEAAANVARMKLGTAPG